MASGNLFINPSFINHTRTMSALAGSGIFPARRFDDGIDRIPRPDSIRFDIFPADRSMPRPRQNHAARVDGATISVAAFEMDRVAIIFDDISIFT
jgi:hypothetical protein